MEKLIKEGKVLQDFNDKEDNLKTYIKGDTFRADCVRYMQLFREGFLTKGRYIAFKNDNRKES